MGRIVAHVRVANLLDAAKRLECDALVDTGAAYLVLPKAWHARLGELRVIREIHCETATQELVKAPVRGPVEIRVEGFHPVYGEVLFLDMQPADGIYEPQLGYIVLEQCQAAVDMLGLRLVHVKKTFRPAGESLAHPRREQTKLNLLKQDRCSPVGQPD